MRRNDGVEIFVLDRLDHLDGPWWFYDCEYSLPGSDEYLSGSIQGDGEEFALDTLEDENGDLVPLIPL